MAASFHSFRITVQQLLSLIVNLYWRPAADGRENGEPFADRARIWEAASRDSISGFLAEGRQCSRFRPFRLRMSMETVGRKLAVPMLENSLADAPVLS